MRTHFASVERANESDNNNYWTDPICGTQTSGDIYMSDIWSNVDCKKCLKQRIKYEEEMKVAMEHSCDDMDGFMKFIEKTNK